MLHPHKNEEYWVKVVTDSCFLMKNWIHWNYMLAQPVPSYVQLTREHRIVHRKISLPQQHCQISNSNSEDKKYHRLAPLCRNSYFPSLWVLKIIFSYKKCKKIFMWGEIISPVLSAGIFKLTIDPCNKFINM